MPLHAIDFVSQRGQPCADSSCGIACISMLLQHAGIRPRPDYHRLIHALRLHARGPHGEPAPAIYPADVASFLRRRRIPFRSIHGDGHKALRRILVALKRGPVMAMARGNEWGNEDHWIILVGEERGMLVYLDPWYRPTQRFCRRMTAPHFATLWRESAFSLR